MRYRKKPVVIDAVQYDGTAESARACGLVEEHQGQPMTRGVPTLEGFMRANPGDWIITGVKGERYPCKQDIFASTYTAADEDRRWWWISYMAPKVEPGFTVHGDTVVSFCEPLSPDLMRRIKDQIAIDEHAPNASYVVITSMIALEQA